MFPFRLTGNKNAVVADIAIVKIIVRVPADRYEIIGSREAAKLAVKQTKTKPAITLFLYAGGIIIAKNIP